VLALEEGAIFKMGNEASKTRELWDEDVRALLSGDGIDIGAGPDLISPNAVRFDQEQGDANKVDEYFDRQFDFVFSSHCLEHMYDPVDAMRRWWSLVKPGGHMILLVPDEDLYEQGYWPSIFNEDHKATFTIEKETSWSPVSHNFLKMAKDLPSGEILEISVQDHDYDRGLLLPRVLPRKNLKIRRRAAKSISKAFSAFGLDVRLLANKLFRIPIDQTAFGALAQIQLVMRKID
jgi:SAM-dependent methyltransferase